MKQNAVTTQLPPVCWASEALARYIVDEVQDVYLQGVGDQRQAHRSGSFVKMLRRVAVDLTRRYELHRW